MANEWTSSIKLNSCSPPLEKTLWRKRPVYLFFKRLMDLTLSAIGLLLLLPLFAVVASLIKLAEPSGKVIFSQQRIGRHGKSFVIYKFRTMVPEAESQLAALLPFNEIEGHMFKIKKDPRITSIGRILRKTSIDELPQLWNVLKGEMSLVGPRPPLAREVADYDAYDRLRLLVKPGCTGLWQVKARNQVGFKEMVAMDLDYIYNRSLLLDIQLIFMTFGVMLRPKGAY